MGRLRMSAEIIDYTPHALQRLANKAMDDGNVFECYAISQLIDGYNEGLWSVRWVNGEPQFEARLTQEELVQIYKEKDELFQ